MSDGAYTAAHEQFITLAKSQRGRALVSLLEKVLESPKIFVFSELLEMEAVRALCDTEFAPHLARLELFAYGTYRKYAESSSAFPTLNQKMIKKLRQLSIVSLAQKSKMVPYSILQDELHVDNVRALEDLILDTIYAGLLDGKLDQASAVLHVKSCIARDIRREDVDSMLQKLILWREHIKELIKVFNENSADIE